MSELLPKTIRRVDRTAPGRIWLQVDAGASLSDDGKAFPYDHSGISWHSEEVGGIEVEYVRADLSKTRVAMHEDVRVALKRMDRYMIDACEDAEKDYDIIRAFVRKVTGER